MNKLLLLLLLSTPAYADSVISLGDSVTWGARVNPEEVYCSFPHSTCKGVSSETIVLAKERYVEDCINTPATACSFEYGLNDASWEDEAHTTHRVEIGEFKKTFEEIIRKVHRAGKKVILLTPNIQKVFSYTANTRAYTEVIRSLYAKYLKKGWDIEMIDTYQISSEMFAEGVPLADMLNDRVHPSALLHERIREELKVRYKRKRL